MNGFKEHGLDEDAFGEKRGNIVQAFDAFRMLSGLLKDSANSIGHLISPNFRENCSLTGCTAKAKPQYITRTSGGGKWTVAMLIVSFVLIFSEFTRWWRGYETHTFSVEKGIGRDLQINLDLVLAMKCEDIHINVQDAAGDRILAAQVLKRDATNWKQWVDTRGVHSLGKDSEGRLITGEGFHDEGFGEEHVHDIIAMAQGSKKKFAKTPRLKGYPPSGDSCRIYGKMDVNKVQADFHITARGHGYQEFGAHLDHNAFNFSHIVNELSFGAFYPSLLNPLDRTIETTPSHFHKFQYFLSVVPTVYSIHSPTPYAGRTIFTNQYAVTEQSTVVNERSIPGIFFKYDIEPMLLTVEENRAGFLTFVVKVVNVFSGVLVAGHWGFTLTEWASSVLGKRRRGKSDGVLNGRAHEMDN